MLIWYFKTCSRFVSKTRRPYEVISFQRIELNEDETFPFLKDECIIGTCGSDRVYKVELKTGQPVAVKRLWGVKRVAEDVFKSETKTLGRIRHGNIVKLPMCCSGEEFRILVYKYMENGSLGDILHGDKCTGLADWPKRFAVAIGTAQGLAYLHHDVKSNNILLDAEMRPRVADFRLVKTLQIEGGNSGVGGVAMYRVAETHGYIAPSIIFPNICRFNHL
ncbi:hypothetical protein V6N12_046639 [Hibiscus sabdariffa]|uniref:Protein kinase domain-containing protein n=1 Tax=Hibiscus sabdariffa TaxID=183260 RepID=A0ABR2B066_9ROSI